jgi:uncharacterized damage-inducible protein DinB
MAGRFDPLGHHVWATRRLLEFCAGLTSEQLQFTAQGTYGAIDQTLAHAMGADEYYVYLLSGERPERPLEPNTQVDLADLRARADRIATVLEGLSAARRDPSAMTPVNRGDAPVAVGVVLAQIVHHGNEHRGHVRTILGAHGITAPDISGWAYGGQKESW